jgi:hypothetical protein
MVCDADGFAIYWVLDDDAIECTACDPEAGELEDWPAWTDADRWTHIDPPDEPTEADVAWLDAHPILPPVAGGSPEPESFEPTDADWDEMARWSAHLDRLEAIRSQDDAEDEARARFG